jgi:hypothetical protein
VGWTRLGFFRQLWSSCSLKFVAWVRFPRDKEVRTSSPGQDGGAGKHQEGSGHVSKRREEGHPRCCKDQVARDATEN